MDITTAAGELILKGRSPRSQIYRIAFPEVFDIITMASGIYDYFIIGIVNGDPIDILVWSRIP